MLFCLLENSGKDTIGWVSRELGDLIFNHLEKKKSIHNEEDLLISANWNNISAGGFVVCLRTGEPVSCPVLSLIRTGSLCQMLPGTVSAMSSHKKPRGGHWKSNSQVALLFEPQKQIQVNLNPSFQIQVTNQ